MAYASDIFDGTMSLIDELNGQGQAQTSDTKEYEYRTPSILNIMVAEVNMNIGKRGALVPVESLEDYVDVDDYFAQSAMKYGLAANLLVDENPSMASFCQQRYEELLKLFVRTYPTDDGWGAIENVYGMNNGIGFENGSRW